MEHRRRVWLACVSITLLAGAANGGECSGWLPDFDPDCEHAPRPAGFAAPVASPFLFEDAFVVTGAQAIYAHQEIPNDSVFAGGEAEVAAGALRIAITEYMALIGGKAGALWTRPDNPLIPERQTPIPLTLGVKLALPANADAGRWAAFVLRYGDAFQGAGDGSLMPSIAGALRAGPLALQGDLGGSWALDSSYSSFVFWHAYAGLARWRHVTPFVQLSGQHWVDGGDGRATMPLTPLGQLTFGAPSVSMRTLEQRFGSFEGLDLVNLGARGIAGRSLVAGAFGAELRFGRLALSAAYEHPLTDHRGMFASRVTTRLSFEL
jgi:hypothetical protein